VRENDGRKLDHKTLEAMRLRAVDAVESGVHPEDVAASLGMGRGMVYGWLAKYREGGKDALRARPVPGRPPKLSGEQMRRLYALIAGADPRQLEFGFALWTRDLVRELIRREFHVSLSAVSVGRLLRTLGLSPQRPLWRAWQADPDAVQRWRDEDFPAIRAPRPRPRGRRSTSVMRLGSARTTTRAPPGPRSGRPRWSRPPGPGTA
jgi:transposase